MNGQDYTHWMAHVLIILQLSQTHVQSDHITVQG